MFLRDDLDQVKAEFVLQAAKQKLAEDLPDGITFLIRPAGHLIGQQRQCKVKRLAVMPHGRGGIFAEYAKRINCLSTRSSVAMRDIRC